jgi:hypothetical protein
MGGPSMNEHRRIIVDVTHSEAGIWESSLGALMRDSLPQRDATP